MNRRVNQFALLTLTFLHILFPVTVFSQYFGRNKPGYKKFNFDVLQTPNFEIYHYLNNDTLKDNIANWAEEWYLMHQKVFKDTFEQRNPLILYSNHSDFQQTNAVSSMIGTTTGGVTEALKNRVVMPIAPTLAQTDHVLGHELVHAFQFHKLLRSDSDTSQNYSLRNIPLWMIEGMAEYLSIGSVDPHTAMWMRDALIHDDFPTLEDLSKSSRYFPYRYGHAFWAMFGKSWSDTLVIPLFEKTAILGFDSAVDTLLGFSSETLSGLWRSAMELHFNPYLADTVNRPVGQKLISKENAGEMNLSPSLSPDGKYLAFFSEKDVFTLDLYLADAQSGKIIKKLSSVTRNHEIDDFSFIESSGTWSPDSRKFAFVVFSKGKNKLAIVDVKRAKITYEIELGNLNSFSNPHWSPEGRYIVVTGLVNGTGDLYLYDMDEGTTTKLTSDLYSNIHPAWSPNGKYIVFSTERINHGTPSKKYCFDLTLYNMETGEKKRLDVFPGADNLNPVFSSDSESIYFLSNADGYRNLYRYDIDSEQVFRLTKYPTGISGITHYSPAISSAANNCLIAYTYFSNGNYEIYTAQPDSFKFEMADKKLVDFEPGTLPPIRPLEYTLIDTTLYTRPSVEKPVPEDSVKEVPYKPKFKLDYISNTAGVGVSTGRFNSTNMSGSVSMIFSDIVGNNQLYSVLALNGEIYDFGGQVAYINQKRKFKWGVNVSHIPYRTGNMFLRQDTLTFTEDEEEYELPVTDLVLDYIRMFEDNISLFSYYPLSQTRRLEAGVTASWYYYRIDRYHNYFDDFGFSLGGRRERRPAPDGNSYQKIDLAYVQDNSYFGMTSPMRGSRGRYQVEKYFGAVNFFTALADYRKYYFVNPFTFAFRLYHYGRYGSNSNTDAVSPIYLGYPWLVRGYEDISFYNNLSSGDVGINSLNYSHLSGSRILVGNAEFRLPVSGVEQLALIRSNYFLIDFNLFFDAGMAWDKGDFPKITWGEASFDQRVPVFSAGASLRINLLGYVVLEPYFAVPFQNGGWENGVFGLSFVPGW